MQTEVSLDSPQKIDVRICAAVEMARGKVVSTEPFTKESVLSRRESGRLRSGNSTGGMGEGEG